MNYQDWEKSVPEAITGDALWKLRVYRLALFAARIGWHDVTRLAQDKRTLALADQLYRSLGSISANIAGGYSRSSGRDRARLYEYALGSARESRDWYYKAEEVLGQTVIAHRLDLQAQIIRLLLTIVPDQRHHNLKKEPIVYEIDETQEIQK
jgi:four helix bundle protein